jgi:aminodeoxyfutalosine deaminase
VHLEGTIQPATLLELARRNAVALPCDTVEGLGEWFRFIDFRQFLEVYRVICACLRTADDYELVTYELAVELAAQNCRYAEGTFTACVHERTGVAAAVYREGLRRGRERARSELGVELAWVFDISRAMRGGADETMRWADYTVDVAIDAMKDGVVALGLGGPEAGYPPAPFARFFTRGRAAGLRSFPHAGEHLGPSSIRGALNALGAERIAHGVRAIEDATLVAELAERRIALDVCPTSNVCLGVCESIARHPLTRLHARGVTITVNSDDPALFGTTLSDEVLALADPLGLGVAAIDEILVNGITHSFLPEPRKREMEAAFRAELDHLKALYLGP